MSVDQGRKLLLQSYLNLKPPKDKVQCMHVYVDGSLKNFRTKDLTWHEEPKSPADFPLMEFCGSATDFDVGNVADYYSKPVRLFKDPFRLGCNKLVFCETYSREGLPTFANNRYRMSRAELSKKEASPSYTFYQPYILLRKDGKPLSYMNPAYDTDSMSGFACGRSIAEAHYKACLYAGVNIESLEPMNGRSQWRYSVGVFKSEVDLGDDVWMSRFLLLRVAEDFGVDVSFEKAPVVASLWMNMESVSSEKKLRIVDSLLSKFVVKEHKPIQIRNLNPNIILSGLQPAVDPYSLCIKILEAFSTVT